MLHFNRLRVADVHRETDGAVVVRFDVPEALRDTYRFMQGQHLAVRRHIGGQEVRRTYSICSGADDGDLRIAIKRQPGGLFSEFANDELSAGDELEVMSPAGSFHTALAPENDKLYVAFAAGSGITPVLSLIRTTLASEPRSRFVLFYGNRDTASIMFRDELADLKNVHMQRLAVHHILSREERDLGLYNGRLGADKVPALCRTAGAPEEVDAFFLCGPASMIDDVGHALLDLGVNRSRIHFERFTSSEATRIPRPAAQAQPPAAAGAQCSVTVVLDGTRSAFQMNFDADTVLEAALDQGIELPYSCMGGVCTTCRAKLIEGDVDLEANYGLEPHELEAGFVLTCQSRPRTERLELDFDATG